MVVMGCGGESWEERKGRSAALDELALDQGDTAFVGSCRVTGQGNRIWT